MDKSWIDLQRKSDVYLRGIEAFLKFAFRDRPSDSLICCPCAKCTNRYFKSRRDVRDHCFFNGFSLNYKNWTYHGELYEPIHTHDRSRLESERGDDMIGLVYEAKGMQNAYGDVGDDTQSKENDLLNGADEDTLKFYQLLEDASRELYPWCTEFTKFSFTTHLLNLKVRSGWTNKSFTLLLELLKKAFPRGVNLPKDFGEANKISKDLGFTYETWDHAEGRVDDGTFRHPADSLPWKDFDEKNIYFSSDSRNVRLGLAADGFSPFKLMNDNFLLSVIIDGPKGPSNKIDVYLQPLIEESKELWENRVETYDISRNEMFSLKAALMWTISDLSGYSMLSGWCTKTDRGCPCCGMEIMCRRLQSAHKYSYINVSLRTFGVKLRIGLHFQMRRNLLSLRILVGSGSKGNMKSRKKYFKPHEDDEERLVELSQGTEPCRIDKFCMSRAPNGKPPLNQDTAKLITQMRESISCVPEAERTRELEETIWTEFMGTDSHGRVRCEGQGVKPSRYRQTLSSYDIMKKKIREEVTQEVKEGIKEENEQMRVEREQMMNEILEMREEGERMKGLMEQMAKKMTQTRAEMTQEVVEDVVSYFGLGSFPVAPFTSSTTPFRPTTTPF